MKLIISLMDGTVTMVSVSRIECIEFKATTVHIIDEVTGREDAYYYKDIRSMIMA